MNQPLPAAIAIIAEDSELIVYRKSLRIVTGSVTSAILLGQLIHRLKKKKRIYKFKAPCQHELYRPRDSWIEELGFSSREFDTALKNIGTKLIKGKKTKEQALLEEDTTAIVIYWTDRNRVTWYEMNWPLLDAYLTVLYSAEPDKQRIYLNDKSAFSKTTKAHLLYMRNQHLHDLTESPTESPTEITPDSGVPTDGVNKKLSSRQKEPNNGLLETQDDTPQEGGFEDFFGDNPRQDEIDAYKDELRPSKAELLLTAFGADVPAEIKFTLTQIRDAGWQIRNQDEERAIAGFIAVTGLMIPSSTKERKTWLSGIRDHLAEENFGEDLYKLYRETWKEIQPAILEEDFNVTRPQALTRSMYNTLNRKNAQATAAPDPGLVLGWLTQKGVVKMIESDGTVTPTWTHNDQPVTVIPRKYADKYRSEALKEVT